MPDAQHVRPDVPKGNSLQDNQLVKHLKYVEISFKALTILLLDVWCQAFMDEIQYNMDH